MRFLRVAAMGAILGAAAIAGVTHSQGSPSAQSPSTGVLTGAAPTAADANGGFVTIENQDETMTMRVPAAWKDVSEGQWLYHGVEAGYYLTASTNLADFQAGKSAPGVFMGVFANYTKRTVAALLDTEKLDVAKRCRFTGRKAYRDPFYVGYMDDYTNCVGGKQRSLVNVVQSGDGSTVVLRVNVASDADIAVANQIFASFQVLGNVNEHDHGHAD